MTHIINYLYRWRQVFAYGWYHSRQICTDENRNISYRLRIFADMLVCYHKYLLSTNKYVDLKFHQLDSKQREMVGSEEKIKICNIREYYKQYYAEQAFLRKYSSMKYNTQRGQRIRNMKYAQRYNCGSGLWIQHNVIIYRDHQLDGAIEAGNNVAISADCYIDYSGGLSIGHNVHFSHGVFLNTHEHRYFKYAEGKPIETNYVIKKPLKIEDNVHIGEGAKIMPSCNSIGRYAIIGAGAVVRCDIPPYAIVAGNPAKVVAFVLPPNAAFHLEKSLGPRQLTYELLSSNHRKYFLDRLDDIQSFLSLSPSPNRSKVSI